MLDDFIRIPDAVAFVGFDRILLNNALCPSPPPHLAAPLSVLSFRLSFSPLYFVFCHFAFAKSPKSLIS